MHVVKAFTQFMLLPATMRQASPAARVSTPLASAVAPAKVSLLEAVASFNAATAIDGLPKIDFGVKGGELDGDTRAPRDLYAAGAYHAVSPKVGAAADRVLDAVDALAATADPSYQPTKGLGMPDGPTACALHGSWSNVFTTAADAVFSPDSKRGGADVYNEVDARTGRVTNCIDFLPRDHPAFRATRQSGLQPSPVESLRVRLSSKATSGRRVELVFRFVKVQLNRFFGLKLKWSLTVPVPGPFLTRLLFSWRPNKRPPPAYFDVLFLDKELRVHKTGQGNVFIQQRRAAT